MYSFYKKSIALFVLAIVMTLANAGAQCTVVSPSGKSITFNLDLASIVTSNTSPGGYNYDYNVHYNFTTANSPVIYYMQFTFESGNGETFGFGGGTNGAATGSSTLTTTYSQYRNVGDYATATPYSLNARNLKISVQFSDGTVERTFQLNRSTPTSGSMSASSVSSSSPAPLPVKLVSFDAVARNSGIDLSWTTASETSNAYFILEKSTDAKNWASIAQMNGAGTTAKTSTYSYTDPTQQNSVSYYRLKQVDANGAAAYSATLTVKAAAAQSTISIYPNPNESGRVSFSGSQNNADWSVTVINTSSAVVYQAASMNGQLDLSATPAGLYFVQLQNSRTGEAQVLRLVRK